MYSLLYENYVEDDDNMFRFNYSREFLQWVLKPPHFNTNWYCGVRVAPKPGTTKLGKLVGFVSAIPARVRVYEKYVWNPNFASNSMIHSNFSVYSFPESSTRLRLTFCAFTRSYAPSVWLPC